jgi:hypothetical protein
MFSDLLVYSTPKFQHAQMVLSLLQLALRKAGLIEEARRLDGLDITNSDMAKGAILVLRAMNVQATGARQAHSMALTAMNEAICSAPAAHN